METQHGSDAALAAIIRSEDGRFELVVSLIPLHEARHVDWHSYSIIARDLSTGKTVALVGADDPLFLDRAIEPEVPKLAAALRSVALGGGEAVFEPVDDRDFSLRVWKDADGQLVMSMAFAGAAQQPPGWADGVRVDRQAVLHFADQLDRAYPLVAGD